MLSQSRAESPGSKGGLWAGARQTLGRRWAGAGQMLDRRWADTGQALGRCLADAGQTGRHWIDLLDRCWTGAGQTLGRQHRERAEKWGRRMMLHAEEVSAGFVDGFFFRPPAHQKE